jgi:hypothetical protein
VSKLEPFLKFITFEFILIAHHYETFIYSLIELHCFTFLASCKKRRGKAKSYDTINKGKRISKVDSTQVAISDLPIQMEGTDYLIHPVGD